jgi:hypothetical protein
MKSTTLVYVGAVILFILSICSIGWGGLMVLGSTSSSAAGQTNWAPLGIGFMCIGTLMIIGGVVLIVNAVRKQNQESPQNVVMKIDLPGDTKISQMKCQSCGGAITSNDVKMMAGAPVVTCPYCQATYQLTEEPKW